MSDETKTPDEIKTVGDLLKAAENDPGLLDRAHRKVWEAISATVDGREPEILSEPNAKDPDVARKRRLYHDQPARRVLLPSFANELFGNAPDLAEIAEYFRQAARSEKFRKMLLEVTGDTGCGKTTLTDAIAERMEQKSFFSLAECEYHEDPLHAIPKNERVRILKRRFKGELCRACELDLQQKYHDDWRSLPVKKLPYRLTAGIGMLRKETALPKPQGSGSIPDDWHQIFKNVNGGIFFVDLARQPDEFSDLLMSFVTDGTLPAKDQTAWWPDFVVVSVGNKKLDTKSATDRVVPIELRFTTDPLVELRIQRKEQEREEGEEDDSHFVPWVEEAGCRILAASRLEADSYQAKLKLKSDEALDFYSGVAISPRAYSYKELREKRPDDGKNGITVRGGTRLLSLVRQYHGCAGITHLVMAFREAGLDKLNAKAVDRIKEQLGSLEKNPQGEYDTAPLELWYQKHAVEDLVRGLSGNATFEKMQKEYFDRYMENAQAYINKTLVEIKDDKGKITDRIEPNEDFMKKLEKQIAIIGSAADGFRRNVVSFYENPPYVLSDYPHLQDAIIKKIESEYYSNVRCAVTGREPDQEKAKTFDPNRARQNRDKIKNELLKERGYQPCCWENLLSYAIRIFK